VKTRALAAVALLATGCGEPLAPPWLIDGPRVLGARVEAADDPGRPWPRPGEAATVTWIVVAPDGAPALHWGFAACLPDAQGGCGTPLVQAAGDGAPALTVTVPPRETLGEVSELVVRGAFCASGTPAEVSGTPRCEGGGAPTVTTLPVPLDLGGEPNRSPSMGSATLTLDGAVWPAGEDCAALPPVAADEKKRLIRFTLAGQREIYQSSANADGVPRPVRETIQLSHFATAGKLPRQLSFIEASDERDPAGVTVDWTAPPAPEVPPQGLLVRFYFVARDLRGGLDWLPRTLCVLPEQTKGTAR
jgi:hypothetical protein